MTDRENIRGFLRDYPRLREDYKTETDKWLFVEYNILDILGINPTETNVNMAENILEEV